MLLPPNIRRRSPQLPQFLLTLGKCQSRRPSVSTAAGSNDQLPHICDNYRRRPAVWRAGRRTGSPTTRRTHNPVSGPHTANAATGNSEPLLHVRDDHNGLTWMIDGGATLSLVPTTQNDRASRPTSTPLQAANGTTIANYGSRHMTIRLGDRRFEWDVTVADVTSPILGADFLMEYTSPATTPWDSC